MGSIFSKKQKTPSNSIRVVNLNGHVEDFDCPLTAGEVTGKPPMQFLCTHAQLMSGNLKPLKPEAQLEPSHVHFMFSYSTIQSEYSPMDVVLTAKRLAKLAKDSRPKGKLLRSSGLPTRGTSSGSEVHVTSLSPLGELDKAGSCKRSSSWKPLLDTITRVRLIKEANQI